MWNHQRHLTWHFAAVLNCSNDNCTLHVYFCLKSGASLIPDVLLSSPKCCAGFYCVLGWGAVRAPAPSFCLWIFSAVWVLPEEATELMCIPSASFSSRLGCQLTSTTPEAAARHWVFLCMHKRCAIPRKKCRLWLTSLGPVTQGTPLHLLHDGGYFIQVSRCPGSCHCTWQGSTATALPGVTFGSERL